MRRSRRLAALAVTLSFGLASGCKKKHAPIEIEAGPPPPEATADKDAKDAVAVIVSTYPAVCDVEAANRAWGLCRDTASGYGGLYGCAEKSLRDARAALAGLRPSTAEHAACGDQIRKTSVELLNTGPKFFADVVRWLQDRHDALLPMLSKMPLGEACRETRDLCTGEPHDYDEPYKSMRIHTVDMIDCTAKLFRCGQADNGDCWLSNVVPRLGVACPGQANRAGASPDDLLYVRETGTPIAR